MKNVSVHLDSEMLEKLRILANRESRSLSNQIVILVRDYVISYEKEHGRIPYKEGLCPPPTSSPDS